MYNYITRVVYRFDTGSLAGIGIDIPYWYWLVGILVGILSTKEFVGNSLNSLTAIRFRQEQKTLAP
jgi:hypothetical protein